jgi:aspartate aminotransferase
MSPNISQRVSLLAESETLAMAARSAQLKAAGKDIINMSVGETDFQTPDYVKLAGIEAIVENWSFYTNAAGYPSLRQAVCHKLEKENHLHYKPSQIVCSNGAKQSVQNILASIVNKGDEVIVPTPAWVTYVELVRLNEGVAVTPYAGMEQGFKITPQQLQNCITDRTRALILCSPSNPSGAVYSIEELRAIAAVLEKYPQIVVISDEIYEHINYTGSLSSIAHCDSIRERCVIINGVSKAYAMTGWRLGWMAAPQYLADACVKLQGQQTHAPSSIAQKAAEAAYSVESDCLHTMQQTFLRRRNLICDLIADIPGLELLKPDGAFYVFPRCSAFIGKSTGNKQISSSVDLAMYLLEQAGVASVGGTAFGAPEHIRFSYSVADSQIEEACERIKKALALLK